MNANQKKRTRLFIYPEDVVVLTGKSYKTALRILNAVRIFYDKPLGSFVSSKEFCTYMGLDEEEVIAFIDK